MANNTPAAERPGTTTIVVGRDFAKQIKTIADHRGITMDKALREYAGPSLLREYRKVVGEMSKMANGAGG